MRQVMNFGDLRNQGFCVHCGGPYETDDHMPSKVFLDRPYPENLPVSPACAECNESFSRDEEYLACLLECVIAGEVNPDVVGRENISRKLRRQPALAARLAAARRLDGETVVWEAEVARVRNVILKLARGHAAFELNEPQLDDPLSMRFLPLSAMSIGERQSFEQEQASPAIWPEVGSRAMNRLIAVDGEVFEEGWLLVQEGRYRYRVLQDDGLRVKIVIREYLAAEVRWG
jgi:hypothetical protein